MSGDESEMPREARRRGPRDTLLSAPWFDEEAEARGGGSGRTLAIAAAVVLVLGFGCCCGTGAAGAGWYAWSANATAP